MADDSEPRYWGVDRCLVMLTREQLLADIARCRRLHTDRWADAEVLDSTDLTTHDLVRLVNECETFHDHGHVAALLVNGSSRSPA